MPLPPARADAHTYTTRDIGVRLVVVRTPVEQFGGLRPRMRSALPEFTLPDVFGASSQQWCRENQRY
ncbi:MAG: hypothetical protein F4117_00320 [Acidimicrobiales bacterium]|nr:hypothetical protein [Acidimicrobiaceae bacterium]MXV88377.1 hypothetical protein [Acidimicrobiales bacterium]MCY3892925.1 hypothetical protein [Acidimicrobiaceae bacterium]MXX43052.1 hypothetical protein [Acidimicrobiales bacterium]MXY03103.1 hypothetical protein [Acidimicrobiales bacterium]